MRTCRLLACPAPSTQPPSAAPCKVGTVKAAVAVPPNRRETKRQEMTFDAVRGAVYINGIFTSLRQAFVLERRTGCVGSGVGMHKPLFVCTVATRGRVTRKLR